MIIHSGQRGRGGTFRGLLGNAFGPYRSLQRPRSLPPPAFAPGRIESRTRDPAEEITAAARSFVPLSPPFCHQRHTASLLTPSGSFPVPLRAEFQSFWLCRGVAGHFFSLPRKGRKIGKQCLSSPSLTFFGRRNLDLRAGRRALKGALPLPLRQASDQKHKFPTYLISNWKGRHRRIYARPRQIAAKRHPLPPFTLRQTATRPTLGFFE